MLAIIIGVIFIIGGVAWFLLAALAAGMASRKATTWENVQPFLGIIPVMLGIAIINWG